MPQDVQVMFKDHAYRKRMVSLTDYVQGELEYTYGDGGIVESVSERNDRITKLLSRLMETLVGKGLLTPEEAVHIIHGYDKDDITMKVNEPSA